MKRQLRGIIRLARYREYIFFVVITTFLGAAAGQGSFGLPLVAVLLANWLAVGYAFMINDVEDAPDDALNPAKANRNPVSAGDLSVPAAQAASYTVAGLSAAIYALIGFWPFVIGASCLMLGHLYSWRPIRLKSIPVLDLVSHALMLAALQFLAAYFTFTTQPDRGLVFPLALIVAISLYGELFNELRDLEGDVRAGVSHTASLIGPQYAYWLMMALLAVGFVSALVMLFVSGLVPTWAMQMFAALEAIFLVPAVWKARRCRTATEMQAPLHMPAQTAGAIAIVIWFIAPWLNNWFGALLLHAR